MNTIHSPRLIRRSRCLTPARAFTLVELMVVIGIIGLLVAIALPALNAARQQAKAVATDAMVNTLNTGMEQFHSDNTVGGSYPPSVLTDVDPSPYGGNAIGVGGANLLVMGLAGADLLGTPGFRDLDPNIMSDPFGNWTNNLGSSTSTWQNNLYALNMTTGKPLHPRSGPYVDLSKVKLTKKVGNQFQVPGSASAALQAHAFLDSWDQPVLYYRASPNATWMADEGSAGGGGNADDYKVVNGRYVPTGIYNLRDNVHITGSRAVGTAGMDLGAGTEHPLAVLGNPQLTGAASPQGSFVHHITNPSVNATKMAHRNDNFILISAGADGLYGTADDRANFPINK